MSLKFKIISLKLITILIVLCMFSTGCIQKPQKKVSNQQFNISFSKKELKDMYNLSVQWLISNIKDKGIFQYIYNPVTKIYPSKNNMIRQLMASRVLADFAQNNHTLKSIHQKNLDFIFTYWYQETNDMGYILYNNKSKLGAMAMALRTLVYSPFYKTYELEANKIANTILHLQNQNGSFEPWFVKPNYSYDKSYLLTFYSGEAILSLLEYYQLTKKPNILQKAILAQNYYLDKYVTHLSDNYYPSYVPWHTMSLYELYLITKNKTYANAIITLNDKLLELQDTSNLVTLGRFYNDSTPEYGSPHSSSDAIYTESLAIAYKTASKINDSYHLKKYKKALVLSIHNLLSLQYHTKNEKLRGALRYNKDDARIRVDTTQHTVDALNKLIQLDSHNFKIYCYHNKNKIRIPLN